MAGKVEFDGDQFLLYKDQSTCTGGPEVVRQPTPTANSGECDGEGGRWKQTLRTKHWVFLVKDLAIGNIVNELYQGVGGKPLITDKVYDEIKAAKSREESNVIFLRHLLSTGTEETLRLFCKVLQDTSVKYPVHEEILQKLQEDKQLSLVFHL